MTGVPLFADECTYKQQRTTFARLLIEVDVIKVLPKTINIEDMNGTIIEPKVHFEWAPPYCLKFHIIRHNCAKRCIKVQRNRWGLNKKKFLHLLLKWVKQHSSVMSQ